MQLLHRRQSFRSTLPAGCLLRLSATLSGAVGALGTWPDQSGNGNDGTLVSGATVTANSGLNCDGLANFCNLGQGKTQFSLAAGTACAWVYAPTTPGNYKGIWSHTRSTGDIYGHFMCCQGNYARAYAYNSSWLYGQSTTPIAATNWFHMGMTWNSSGVSMWINGTSEKTTNANSPAYSGTVQTNVGRYGTGSSYIFSGIIDEVMVFDRVLSAAEIAVVKALNSKV